MDQYFTSTRSGTSTVTAARVRIVMLEVTADFLGLVAAGLITFDQCTSWTEDLTFVLEREAAHGYQIQLKCFGYLPRALEYRVSADGTIQESSKSGGIDYFSLPTGTKATLFLELDFDCSRIETVKEYLRRRGWGFDGQAVTGNTTRDRAYSNAGYGVIRHKVGDWS